MDKRQASYYLRRIYRLIKENKVHIVLNRLGKNFEGMAYFEARHPKIGEIQLNPDFNFLTTFVHECLHIFYPEAEEKLILKMECEIYKSLSVRQLKNLLFRLSQVIHTKPHN